MDAQNCYDDRNVLEFCSGSDLADFFSRECGEPSPSGNVQIDATAWTGFVSKCMSAMDNNSPASAAHLRVDARFAAIHPASAAGM